MALPGAARRMLAGALVAGAVAALLTGCSRPSQSDGDRVAEWIDAQNWVESASAGVSTDPWSPGAGFTITVDPSIPDDDLHDLAAAGEKKAQEAGWSDPYLVWEVGDGRSFSNADRAAFPVFVKLRNDPRYLVASARGDGECGTFYCVTVEASEPAVLLQAVKHLLSLADAAGGVQENLDFDATSSDGRFTVSAKPDAAVDASVAVWLQIAETVPLVSASAWVVEPVGDIPASPMLNLTVADEAAAATAQQIAATQSAVEVRVAVEGADSTTSTPAP